MPAEDKVIRKLRAILSADVKGYSLLMSDDEAFTVKTLKEYRALMAKLIEQHTGRVVDDPGDNLLAEFASVVDAVRCAVEIQKLLKEKNEDLPNEKRLEFRIGVNIGDVIQDQDRLYGEGVNIAARIEGLAEAGGVCISRNAYDHIKNKLALGYEYIGEHNVKNIKDSVRVYKLLLANEDAGKLIGDVPKPVAKKWIWATAVLAVIVITSIFWQVYQKMTEPEFAPAAIDKMAFPLPAKPSIAVLPFRNMSGDPDQDYFGDGISENIITALSQNPNVFVISRESSFIYKDQPKTIKEISEDLGVNFILEGSIHKSINAIRITAQLIDSIKGYHVWAKNYDREVKDLFSLYDDITLSILKGIQAEFQGGIKYNVRTDKLEAYQKVLMGGYHLSKYSKEDNLIARRLFEEALNIDPEYSDAIANLTFTYLAELRYFWTGDRFKTIQRAKNLAFRAVEMDSENFMCYWALSEFYLLTGEFEKALLEIKKAMELNPGESMIQVDYAITLWLSGHPEEALKILEKVIRKNPHIEIYWVLDTLAINYFIAGRYEESISTWEKRLNNRIYLHVPNAGLTLCYLATGNIDTAKTHAKIMLEIEPSFNLRNYVINYYLMEPKKVDQLITPIQSILYKDSGKIAEYKYSGSPKFSFNYPATYKISDATFHINQIVAFQTDKGQGFFWASVYKIPEGMTFEEFTDEIYLEGFKGFATEVELKNKKNIKLRDGTIAYRRQDYWTFINDRKRYINESCIAFKGNIAVMLLATKSIDDETDLGWIVESLTFE